MKSLANQERILQDIEVLRRITEPCACGTQRPSYTPEYRRAVDYVKGRMEEFGLKTREDNAGNLYGVLAGSQEDAPKILSGSHLDSVKCSGAYDGIAGVLCALEAARMVAESGRPLRHPLEVMGTIGEEGTRFGQALIGSQLVEGSWGEAQLDAFRGLEDGLTLREAMQAYGLPGSTKGVCRRNEQVKAFVELHDEQGPILENEGVSIGVVENIVAISWMHIKVKGLASHPGTIPMSMRHDACVGACKLICAATDYAREHYDGEATVTAGKLEVFPGNTNCIPSQCKFTIDIRTCNGDYRDDLVRFIQEKKARVEEECRVSIEVCEGMRQSPTALNPKVQQCIEEACKKLGYSWRRMNSGAGHDAMIFARIWPAAMVFVQSHNGLTHHPDEYVPPKELAKGADVLYETFRLLDAQPDE
ncbi:MAG: M20 family metallo-hydrolase [Provencibacterium sp.]|nr:M20 family metallo-hydrolase [Provencibacterium sp.]